MVPPEGGSMREKQMPHEHRLGASQWVYAGMSAEPAASARPASRQNKPGHGLLDSPATAVSGRASGQATPARFETGPCGAVDRHHLLAR